VCGVECRLYAVKPCVCRRKALDVCRTQWNAVPCAEEAADLCDGVVCMPIAEELEGEVVEVAVLRKLGGCGVVWVWCGVSNRKSRRGEKIF
jgi:hypothetical protein